MPDEGATMGTGQFFTTDPKCEGHAGAAQHELLGHIAVNRGSEMLRALRRCGPSQKGASGGVTHALDLLCDVPDSKLGSVPLGFVR